ncbi:unnamed protein product [Notodromas monacha]|uniref:Glycosyltransferase family 92 protein n=1 Tax=Notodromas monacha TaxID=399045 RepID=A0A7R9BW90_9CRUS|nr:unnamed protein product [Notodromas monacha]CAG0921388.1 unnamed protein product [Notodromas monacha]
MSISIPFRTLETIPRRIEQSYEPDFNLTDEETLTRMEAEIPNVPVKFWRSVEKKLHIMQKGGNCAQMPNIFELAFNNLVWQQVKTSKGTFYLYSAYFDIRPLSPAPTLRILSMIEQVEPTVPTFCQIWFENSTKPVIANVSQYRILWNKAWGTGNKIHPFSIECEVPSVNNKTVVPVAVSVVENSCDKASNLVKVTHRTLEPGKKKSIAVCVKRMQFVHEEPVFKLIEFLELVRVLGAEKVYLYAYEPQPNPRVERILRYYEAQGLLEVSRVTMPASRPNSPILRHLFFEKHGTLVYIHQMVSICDCIYKSFYQHDLVALIDLDEVIIPENGLTWREIIKNVTNGTGYSAITFNNAYYPLNNPKPENWNPGFPAEFPMLNTVYRLANYSKPGDYVKPFLNTSDVLIAHSHLPLGCIGPGCRRKDVPVSAGTWHHYRTDLKGEMKNQPSSDNTTVADYSLWKWKDELVKRATRAAKDLGYL